MTGYDFRELTVQPCLEFIDADKPIKEDITIGTNTSIEWDITIKENLCCGMKPYSGRDGGHNAGYHSANALLGMIHGITRLIELVASRKFSGKRIPRSKPRFIALPPGDILWQFIWSIVLTISFLNYLVGPIEFGKMPYQDGLGRIYLKSNNLYWLCIAFARECVWSLILYQRSLGLCWLK